jgi:hypothetical protein
LATWLRLVELEEEMEDRTALPTFADAKLSEALVRLRALSAAPNPASFSADLVDVVHEAGVQLVLSQTSRVRASLVPRDGETVVRLSRFPLGAEMTPSSGSRSFMSWGMFDCTAIPKHT